MIVRNFVSCPEVDEKLRNLSANHGVSYSAIVRQCILAYEVEDDGRRAICD